MSNNDIVRRLEEAFLVADLATVDGVCSPDLVDHNPFPGFAPTLDGFKQAISLYDQTFGDKEMDLTAVIGEGDLVATMWTVAGTHKEEFFGVPATGIRCTVEGMNFYRLADGRITEVWTQFDGVGLLQQIGALPS